MNHKEYETLIKSAANLTSLDFSEIQPGCYYELVQFNTIPHSKNYIKVIFLLRNGSSVVEGPADHNSMVTGLTPNPGIWYSVFNLDTSRNCLVPVFMKKSNYSFMHQLDYEIHWALKKIDSNIKKL
jgi:hypothetical protein